MIENTRYFIDMDGTLAVFNSVKSEEELFEKGYFENLDMQENICLAVSELSREIPNNVYILSSYLEDSKFALNEKKNWLKKNVPEIPEKNWLFVPCGNRKADYVPNGIKPTDVLVDDYGVNIKEWKEACPDAKYVKVCRDENDIEVEKSKISEEDIGFISNDLHETEILEIITLGGERTMTFNVPNTIIEQIEELGLKTVFYDEEKEFVIRKEIEYLSNYHIEICFNIGDNENEFYNNMEKAFWKFDALKNAKCLLYDAGFEENLFICDPRSVFKSMLSLRDDLVKACNIVSREFFGFDKLSEVPEDNRNIMKYITEDREIIFNDDEESMPSIEDFNEKNTFDIGLSENISNEISEEMGHSR